MRWGIGLLAIFALVPISTTEARAADDCAALVSSAPSDTKITSTDRAQSQQSCHQPPFERRQRA